ncbi:terminase, partial [Actinomyces sp. MRS3W]|uniref:terminase n=1 Tax=Actinomyces sp. MRS3W TaxID=2800796 RepID=UPI0028FDC42B
MTSRSATSPGRQFEPHLSTIAKHLILPEGIVSTGWPAVEARCKRMGLDFDRWQADLGRAILAKREDGQYAAGVGGVQLSMPRQVGKTYTLGAITFALATLYPDLLMLWTAHRSRTADETFESMRGLALREQTAPFVERVRQANGQQSIHFHNGSRLLFGARESGFGRGFAKVDILIFDEAQILTERALDDMIPSTNAAPNALVLRAGTPPKPTDPSEPFAEFRRSALAGDLTDGLYVELGADDEAAVDDRRQWRKANPSYPRRTPESSILRMKRQLGAVSFRREGLGIWDRDTITATAIDEADWKACLVGAEDVPAGARWCAALRFSVDGSVLALARAGAVRTGRGKTGPVHVELVGLRPMSDGVAWAAGWVARHADRLAQIVVEGRSGAGDMADRLRSAGVPAKAIITPSAQDAAAAHAMADAAIREHSMTHLADDELAAEVAVATRRRIGRNGGFGWSAP